MDRQNQARAASFGKVAAEYDRGRPGYPAAAVDWMIPAGATTVADVGAGTGKFTRLLVGRGLDVTAVDPTPQMLELLRASIPGVAALEGSAERIPLADASVDLVTAAQAWHWVDDARAFPEVARVLRPGGTLALVWNFRDNREGWMRQLADLITDRIETVEVASVRESLPPFEPFEHEVFEWTSIVTRDEFIDLVVSRSVFIVADEVEQQRVLAGVNDLLETHPELTGRTTYELPYRTHAFRARLRK